MMSMAFQLQFRPTFALPSPFIISKFPNSSRQTLTLKSRGSYSSSRFGRAPRRPRSRPVSASAEPLLDLTEDSIRQVLADARLKFSHLFDASVGMTGQVDLAELDGPFVKLSLKGRFWHERSMVLARLGTYLKNRIPEILEVDIEDEKQLDDSPENF